VLSGEFVREPSGMFGVRLKDGAMVSVADGKQFQPGTNVVVSIRPEQLRMQVAASDGCFPAVIKTVMPLGAHVVYDVAFPQGPSLKVSEPREAASAMREPGATVYLKPVSPDACHVFPSPERTSP